MLNNIRNASIVLFVVVTSVGIVTKSKADILLKAVGKNEVSLRPKTMDSQIDIHGQIAQIKTTLTMASELDQQSEADFEYTVPDNTLVTYFAYWYKGKKVIARIVTKERAAEIYRVVSNIQKTPRRPQGDPALVEMKDNNTFHVRIFPIEANADLKVEIHSVQMLDSDAKGSTFTFPLKAPEKNKGTFEKIHLHLQLYPDGDVSGISNNYNLPLIRKDGAQSLDLQQQNWRAPQDLTIRFTRPMRALNSSLYSARASGESGFFALTLTPSQDIPKPRLEIQGIKTWQLLPAKLAPMKAHVPVLVTGRYSGSGAAKVLLHGYGENGVLTASNYVEFSAKQVQPNASAQLWAKLRMQQLSENAKNKSAVMQLSKRFNLPSKYTSWLALPEEGRKIYEKNLAENDLEDYGSKLATLIAAGKGNSASARALRKLVEKKSVIAEENPDNIVARYLAWQIENVAGDIVRAKEKEKTSVKYVQQKQHYLNMLLSFIPTHTNGYIKSSVNEIAKTDYRNAVNHYVSMIQKGNKDTTSAKALRGHIERFYTKHPSTDNRDEYGLAKPNFKISEAAHDAAWQLLSSITQQKIKGHADSQKVKDEELQLKQLIDGTGLDIKALEARVQKNTFEQELYDVARASSGTTTSNYVAKIKKLQQQSPEFARRVEIDKTQEQQILRNVSLHLADDVAEKYFSLKRDSGKATSTETVTQINTLHAELEEMARLINVPYNDLVNNEAKPWAHSQLSTLTTAILAEETKSDPDASRLKLLKNQLNEVAEILQYKAQYFSDSYKHDFVKNYRSDKTAEQYLQDARFQQVSTAIENTNAILAVEKTLKHPDVEYDQELESKRQEEIKNFSPKTQDALKKQIGYYASWDHSLHIVRDLLLREYTKETPDTKRAEELKSKLIELEKDDWYLGTEAAKYTSARNITNPILYGNLRAQRLELRANREKLEDKIKSESDPSQVKTLNDQRAKIMAQQKKLIARMGDPLISVQAPDALSVVALMPDGQTKQLVYEAQKDRWEARFDIPASATEGQYTIQIIVVRKDGSRQMLTMQYSVDLTPPRGTAQMNVVDKDYSGQKVLRLQVQTDENAARVSALLPWGDKEEMALSENTPNQFFALTPVPKSYDESTFAVTFVLTDKAHNRTKVTLKNDVN